PLRRQEPLVLQVPDLRDRDVRELGLEAPAHGSDGEQARAGRGFGGRHQRRRKVSRYLPTWSSSPSESSADSTRRRLTNVPFRLPWSSRDECPARSERPTWLAETVTSSRNTAQPC